LGASGGLARAVVMLVLAHLLWSTNHVLGRVLVAEIPPVTLAALRWLIATPLLALLVGREGLVLRPGRGLRWLLALALSGIFAFNTLLYLSLAYITASRSAIIYGFTPALISILAILLLGEFPNRPQSLGIVLSIAGVALITLGSAQDVSVGGQSLIGDVVALGASLSWAFYTVAGGRVMGRLGYSPQQATFYAALYSLPFAIAASSIELYLGARVVFNLLNVLMLLYVSGVVAVLGFTWWYAAVRIVGANVAGPFSNLIPVFTALLGFAFLHEALSLQEVAGGALVILGAFLAAYWRRV